MWSFLLLSLLVAPLDAAPPEFEKKLVKLLDLPNGFANGTIITLYFKHHGYDYLFNWEAVNIDFYDLTKDQLEAHESLPDIPAYLVFRHAIDQIASGSRKSGIMTENQLLSTNEGSPRSDAWWRIDIYKVNEHQLAVFFNGFWAYVHTFDMSLDHLRSMVFSSDNVDVNSIEADTRKSSESQVPVRSEAEIKDFITYERPDFERIPNFPIGTTLHMTAMMKTTGWSRFHKPALVFKTVDGEEFLRIHQEGGHNFAWVYFGGEECAIGTNDMLHLALSRKSTTELQLEVFYNNGRASGVTCTNSIASEFVPLLEKPFDIMSHHGAFLLFAQTLQSE